MGPRFLSYVRSRLGVLADGLLDPLLPRFCLACAQRVPASEARLHLCRACRGRLAALPAAEVCARCARPLPRGPAAVPVCGGCLVAPPPWRGLLAVWRYQPPFDAVVRAYKYRGLDFLGAELAAAALPRLAGRLPAVDLALPVPSPVLRRLQRGFNPAERFGRPLAAGMGVPFRNLLARGWLGRAQAGRTRRERLAEPLADLRVRPDVRIGDLDLLLIDDVLTTGATAGAATRALLRAGARSVTVLVAGWRPPPGGLAGPSGGRRGIT